jgi:hypothetical protein
MVAHVVTSISSVEEDKEGIHRNNRGRSKKLNWPTNYKHVTDFLSFVRDTMILFLLLSEL